MRCVREEHTVSDSMIRLISTEGLEFTPAIHTRDVVWPP
jgi:hypothetical protein